MNEQSIDPLHSRNIIFLFLFCDGHGYSAIILQCKIKISKQKKVLFILESKFISILFHFVNVAEIYLANNQCMELKVF